MVEPDGNAFSEECARASFRASARRWLTRTRAVDSRVDWFEVAYRVQLDRRQARYLRTRQARVRTNGRGAEVRVSSGVGSALVGELLPATRPGQYTIRNRALTIRVDLNAREMRPDGVVIPGWSVKVEWRAAHLAQEAPNAERTRLVAAMFGQVCEGKVMRVDVARTFMFWRIAPDDRDRLVLRGRSKVTEYGKAEPGEDTWIVRHGTPRRDTGFVVSQGNPLSARCYDKIADLVAKRDARWRRARDRDPTLEALTAKGEAELSIWRAAGWAEGIPLTRLEFQWRGEALAELSVDDPAGEIDPYTRRARRWTLRDPKAWERADVQDQAWRYCVGEVGAERKRKKGEAKKHRGWMRLVLPATSTRKKRAEIDPRWSAARAPFGERAGARALRVGRKPGAGASWKQALGASISCLAAAGELRPVPNVVRYVGKTRVHLDEREVARGLSDFGAAQLVRFHVGEAFAHMGRLAAEALLTDRETVQDAAEWLMVRIGGARARHAELKVEARDRARAEFLARGIHPRVMWSDPPQRAAG